MSQPSWQKHQQSLDTLQSMVNAVLIETGNALRSANRKGPKTIGHTHDRLQGFLPSAIDKFHLALDELEGDIVRAKAVLGRDLRELQARRENLQHPQTEQAEKDVISEDQPAQLSEPQAPTAPEANFLAVRTDVAKGEDIQTKNTAMPVRRTPEPKTESLSEPILPASKIPGQVVAHEFLEKSARKLAVVKNQGADVNADIALGSGIPEVIHGLGITTSSLSPSRESEAPGTGGLQDSNYDPLFETAGDGGSLNFDDFTFTGDDNNGQNDNFAVNSGDFDMSSFGNPTKMVDGDPGDPGNMLQGLDSFDNDGDVNDYSMLDLPNATTNNQNTDPAGGDFGMSGGDLEFALGMGANESSFDDLLNGMDFGEDDNARAGEMMDHGEFDDAFFSGQ